MALECGGIGFVIGMAVKETSRSERSVQERRRGHDQAEAIVGRIKTFWYRSTQILGPFQRQCIK